MGKENATMFAELEPEIRGVMDALSNDVRYGIVQALSQKRHLRFTDLMAVTDRKPGSLAPHLKQLQLAGLIRKTLVLKGEESVESYALSPFGRGFVDGVPGLFVPALRVVGVARGSTAKAPDRERTIRLESGTTGTFDVASA